MGETAYQFGQGFFHQQYQIRFPWSGGDHGEKFETHCGQGVLIAFHHVITLLDPYELIYRKGKPCKFNMILCGLISWPIPTFFKTYKVLDLRIWMSKTLVHGMKKIYRYGFDTCWWWCLGDVVFHLNQECKKKHLNLGCKKPCKK